MSGLQENFKCKVLVVFLQAFFLNKLFFFFLIWLEIFVHVHYLSESKYCKKKLHFL